MSKHNKLELVWVGKDAKTSLEPRVLIEDKEKSYSVASTATPKSDSDNTAQLFLSLKEEVRSPRGNPTTIHDNMLIHGDNLLGLKSIENEYAGKVKCIYIDPPYNTGNAFEHYDDGYEHSIWLGLMRDRLKILRNLLSDDGIIFVQIDDAEQAYLKVLMDEVFGRKNFINMICCKTKVAGVSGSHAEKSLQKNIEFILLYTKSNNFEKFKGQYQDIELVSYIKDLEIKGKGFAYNSVMIDEGKRKYYTSTKDGKGNEIKIYKHSNYILKSISSLGKEDNLTKEECYKKYFDKIFRDTNAQSSIRTRVMEVTNGENSFFSIDYIPVSGRSKNTLTTLYYKGQKCYLIA